MCKDPERGSIRVVCIQKETFQTFCFHTRTPRSSLSLEVPCLVFAIDPSSAWLAQLQANHTEIQHYILDDCDIYMVAPPNAHVQLQGTGSESDSSGSSALYPWWINYKSCDVVCQVMPRGSTSEHWHPDGMDEHYMPIAPDGNTMIHLEGNGGPQQLLNHMIVPPSCAHQLVRNTGGCSIHLLLLTDPTCRFPDRANHRYCRRLKR